MPNEPEPYQLIVRLSGPPQHALYEVCWLAGNDALGGRNGFVVSGMLPPLSEIFIDAMPFLAARLPLYRGHDPTRLLIVTLEGGDCELVRAPLGVVAATPLLNTAAPVEHSFKWVYSSLGA